MTSIASIDPLAELADSVHTEVPIVEEDKRTPENSVPNIIISCTADDDIEAATNALQMIDTFNFPTLDEVHNAQYTPLTPT